MSATDELRRLLDERGVEYKDRDMFGKHVFQWGEPLHGAMFTDGGEWTELVVENATPEQAIEATLGETPTPPPPTPPEQPPYDLLIDLLRDEWDIDVSWDELRRFWYVGLTDEGVRKRDEREVALGLGIEVDE